MKLRLVCLDVADRDGYARYRAAMEPLLAACGGRFLLDVAGGDPRIHPAEFSPSRVLLIAFPSARAAADFFADPIYCAARERWFEPAVRQSLALEYP